MNLPAQVSPPQARPTMLSVLDQEALAKIKLLRGVSARPGPPLVPYGSHRRYMDSSATLYFMLLDDRHYYVPKDLSKAAASDAARHLFPGSGIQYRQRHMLALGRLFALTAGPKRTADERDFLLNSYLSKTLYFPIEVVEYVLDSMAGSCKFFPAWAEIEQQLTALCGWRGRAHHALTLIADKLQP